MHGTAYFTPLALVLFFLTPVAIAAQPPRTDAHGDSLPEGALFRFGSVQWRHGAGISNSALSPDGKSLATASDRSVIVWDVLTGKRVRHFPCHLGSHFATPGLAFSPDGKRLGYVPNSEFACVWDLDTGKEMLRLAKDWRRGFALCHFTPDGKEFAVVDGRRVAFWDLASAQETRSIPIEYASLLSPDATTYLRVKEKRDLVFGDAKTGEEKDCWDVKTAQNGIRNGIAFTPDGKTLAVVHQDMEIQIRTPLTAGVRQKFPVPDSAKHNDGVKDYWEYVVGFSRDGKTLHLATFSGAVHRWDLATGKELPPLKGHQGRAVGCHHLPDGKTVLTTGADGLIRRWDAATGQELSERVGYAGPTTSAYSPDGRFAAVGDARRLDLWDAKTGKRLRELTLEGKSVSNLAFAPDSESLAVGLSSGEVRLWEVPSGREAKTLRWQEKRHWSFAHSLLFSPDGCYLYVSDYPSRTWLWEIATGKVVWRGGGECASALSPDGATLVTAYAGPWVQVRDATTGKERAKFRLNTAAPENMGNVVTAMAFSPDGRRLAVALQDGKVSLCDSQTGEESRQFSAVEPSKSKFAPLAFGHTNNLSALMFSPDGRWLLTAGTDDLVRVWEVATGAEVLRRLGHEGGNLHVAYGPGGRTALSSGSDGQAYLWDLRPMPFPKATPEALWDNLVAEPGKAYRAVWALSEAGEAAKLLRGKIAPVPPADPGRVKKLIGELDSAQFKVRSEATRALAELGELASPAMAEALKKKPALEMEQRLRKLLDALKRQPSPIELQRLRAVQALELAGTPEAREVLRAWAGGAVGSRLTEDARAALARLQRHDVLKKSEGPVR